MNERAQVTLPSRLTLSFLLVATVVAVSGFTWSGWTGEHVFNPDWHPHARFHAAQLVFFAVLMSLGGLWLLWRRTAEPSTTSAVVACGAALFWAGELFALAVPGTSPSPEPANPNTFPLLGVEVHGNLVFTGLMILLAVVGGALGRTSTTRVRRSARRSSVSGGTG